MSVNPFIKSCFSTHRDWEEALLVFLVNEIKHPDLKHWYSFANESADVKRTAGCCALLLCNLIRNNKAFSANLLALRSISNELLGSNSDVEDYGAWLKSGWVSVSRLASMLKHRLR